VVYSDEIDDTLCDTITAVSIDDDDDGFEYWTNNHWTTFYF
jgi:hypothetical protein